MKSSTIESKNEFHLKKIIILINRIDQGGLSAVAIAQEKALINQGFFCETIKLENLGLWRLLLLAMQLTRQRHQTLILTHGFVADTIGYVLRFARCKVSSTVHGYYPDHVKVDYKGFSIKKVLTQLMWRHISANKHNIFLSNDMRNFYLRNLNGNDKIDYAVVSNFYSFIKDRALANFNDEESKTPFLEFVKEKDKTYISVAGESYRKGYDLIQGICVEHPDITILNFGCKNLTSSIPNLINLPQCENWQIYLKYSAGLIHASRAEGQPLAVIETLCCNKSAYVTNIRGHCDLIKKYSKQRAKSFNLCCLSSNNSIEVSDREFTKIVELKFDEKINNKQ